ncbi:MAG: GNAT family N-acetyltransferase [Solirubrobacteraceae bacterium]|nr:GNAT family N-acetyltransferase [Solirubrobacteraceae bacterium]
MGIASRAVTTADHLILRGPTLTLRIPEPGDAAALYALASDPDVTRWFSWGPYTAEAQARAYLERLPGQRRRGEQLDLVQEHREHGVIGITGLSEFSLRDRRALVGTWFGKEHWGTGANAESKALICHLGFDLLGLERITSIANTANDRSRRALEKAGFRYEGVLRGWHRHGDQQLDVAIVGLLRGDWAAMPEKHVPYEVEGEPPAAFVPPA